MTPIYQTSTYVQSRPGDHKGFEYSRTGNPTRSQLEASLASLENGKYGLCFSSGLGAIDAVIKLLNSGDEVICTDDLYGGSYRIFTKIFEPLGVIFHFVDMADISNVKAKINDKTRLIWVETPTNPMMKIIDIEGLSAFTKGTDMLLAVDNTFASPYLQNPLDLGADIVMHSVTKFISGHSDVVMGALVTKNTELNERLAFIQNSCGAVPGPMDSFLALRGIKTLHVRMDRHCSNAAQVAYYLRDHKKVDKVYWPGFEDHPNHQVAKMQMRNFGGMISFNLRSDTQQAAHNVISRTKVFALAESLGGVESLVGHPATMTHAAIPREERMKIGLSDSLIRLSVGLEDIDDIIFDLNQAIG